MQSLEDLGYVLSYKNSFNKRLQEWQIKNPKCTQYEQIEYMFWLMLKDNHPEIKLRDIEAILDELSLQEVNDAMEATMKAHGVNLEGKN
jgi:hypothetical protein